MARQELFLKTPFLLSKGQSDERISSDSIWYIEAAKGFLKGRGVVTINKNVVDWTDKRNAHSYKEWKEVNGEYVAHKNVPPLYPIFLSLCYFIGGFNILAYFIPQILLSSLTCVLIYLITDEIFDKIVALVAGFIMAFNLDLIFWSGFVRTETLFIFLIVLGFFLLIKGNIRKIPFLIYLSSIVFGFACSTRITITPFVPIISLWLFLCFSKCKKESLKVSLLMILIVFVILLPWGIRNYVVLGEFNILSEESGILIGSIENGEQYKDAALNKGYDSADFLFFKTLVFIKDNFKIYLLSCWRRFLIFWSPFTYVMKPLAKVYKGLSWIIIFPAAFWGMIVSRKRWKRGAELIIIFIFYHALLHCASFMDLGLVYRYPIQPFLCIFAGYTFYEIYKLIDKKITAQP